MNVPPSSAGLPLRRSAAPSSKAHVIADDNGAIEAAARVSDILAAEAGERDRQRRLPYDELDILFASGLGAITVPKDAGGADVSYVTVAEVARLIGRADPSIGHIIINNFTVPLLLRACGTAVQQTLFYQLLLDGYRFGNANAEVSGPLANSFATTIRKRDGRFIINGRKFFSTGALLCQFILAHGVGDDGSKIRAIVRSDAPGLSIIDDWDGFGQKTTASGTVIFENVEVEESYILTPLVLRYPPPLVTVAQLMHAAVDAGIAAAALDDLVSYVREHTRPWRFTNVKHGYEDPHIVAGIGRLRAQLHGAEALLSRAGRAIDEALANPADETRAAASIATAEAKVLTTEAALAISTQFFQFAGARATTAQYMFDRHWRNARVHTVHDPVHWRLHQIGDYALSGRLPPHDDS